MKRLSVLLVAIVIVAGGCEASPKPPDRSSEFDVRVVSIKGDRFLAEGASRLYPGSLVRVFLTCGPNSRLLREVGTTYELARCSNVRARQRIQAWVQDVAESDPLQAVAETIVILDRPY